MYNVQCTMLSGQPAEVYVFGAIWASFYSIPSLVAITPFRRSFIRDVWIASVRFNTNYKCSVEVSQVRPQKNKALSLQTHCINPSNYKGHSYCTMLYELSEKWRVKMNNLTQLGSSTEQMTNGRQTHLD